MKVSENWLREWVNPQVNVKRIAEQLTFAGLEVEALTSRTAKFTSVVVGHVVGVQAHPQASHLKICVVDSGKRKLQVVCGAPNVRVGMRAPLALVGASLPNDLTIKAARLRGVESLGMLCSAKELGLSDDDSGLMSLPDDAPTGKQLAAYLGLPDSILELKLTPNRGDCLSIAGVAREVAAINCMQVSKPRITAVKPGCRVTLDIALKAPEGCPIYLGRVIRQLRPGTSSPWWLTDRLREAGLRPIHPVVDVTNYVMLELGQPMHAFALPQLQGGITVRWARENELLTLLDGRRVVLSKDVLVIADRDNAKALAGIMGSGDSGVAADTTDIFLESAFFTPQAVAGRARRFGLHTDAAYRFERGVDPSLQRSALERATALLISITGGIAGPVVTARVAARLPRNRPLRLRRARLASLLGVAVPDRKVTGILKRLGMGLKAAPQGWQITPPGFRFDITREEDLIEEVARLHGFDRIPTRAMMASVRPGNATEHRVPAIRLKEVLVQRGYREVITYSFVPPALDRLLMGGEGDGPELLNPISAEMSHLRRSLWTGLVQTLNYNLNRQQERVRIFEFGRKYISQGHEIKEINCIAGLAYGRVEPEQWSIPARPMGFEDMKADVEAMLDLSGKLIKARFVRANHSALHPGRSAQLHLDTQTVGWLGELHPKILKQLNLSVPPLIFELELEPVSTVTPSVFAPISRYPFIRRDLAVVVAESVTAEALQACAAGVAPELIREVRIFDIYRGSGIDSGRKSAALGLILQDSSRTLTDDTADAVMILLAKRLQDELGATIRD